MIANASEQVQGWLYLGPVLMLTATILLLLFADMVARLLGDRNRGVGLAGSMYISLGGTLASAVWAVWLLNLMAARVVGQLHSEGMGLAELFTASGYRNDLLAGRTSAIWTGGAVIIDPFSMSVCLLICAVLAFVIIILYRYLKDERLYRFEVYPLVLLSAVGMLLLGMSRDLLVTFIAIEILSLPLYVLCGMIPGSRAASESSLKYFLTGAFASGFFIYGAALIYGQVGHLNYKAMQVYLTGVATHHPGMFMTIGVALVGAGIAFKLALVPFHAWVPDVYQGAPTPITAFMSTGVKIAIFAAAMRFFAEALEFMNAQYWQDSLMVFAVLSMLVGNLFALHQMSAKRLLAYSAIAHTGYLAVGLATGEHYASQSMLIYLIGYAAAGLGAFTIITYLSPKGQDDVYLDELHELSRRSPLASALLAVFLLSMGGFPLTAGFIGKLAVFTDAWRAGLWPLVVFAVIMSVVSFYYYLRFMLAMYMQPKAPGERELVLRPMPAAYSITSIAMLVLTILFGVAPGLVYQFVHLCAIGL